MSNCDARMSQRRFVVVVAAASSVKVRVAVAPEVVPMST